MKGFRIYIVVLLITCAIFGSAWFASAYFNARKFAKLQDAQNKISLGILSSETQFDLEHANTCDVASVFSTDLANLAEKISYSEENVATPGEIDTLKKQYTLLEIRDFLLNKRTAERCNQTFTSIFYFYGTKDSCTDCVKQGYILDAIKQKFPDVRIYAFDYNLDLDSVRALKASFGVVEPLPALVINGVTYQGYHSLDEVSNYLKK